MRLEFRILIFLTLTFVIATIAFSATEIRGVLDRANQKYVVVNKHKYTLSKSTVIVYHLHGKKKQIPYSPRYIPHNSLVAIKLENGVVKQIIILGVPQ